MQVLVDGSLVWEGDVGSDVPRLQRSCRYALRQRSFANAIPCGSANHGFTAIIWLSSDRRGNDLSVGGEPLPVYFAGIGVGGCAERS